MKFMNTRRYAARAVGLTLMAGTIMLAGCDVDDLLEVTDPETVNPGTLDDPALLSTVVNGAYGEFVNAYSGGESYVSITALMSDEYRSVGSFPTRTALDKRDLQAPNQGNTPDGTYLNTHQARFALADAAERVEQFEGKADPRYSEMRALEALTYVIFGEAWCPAVPISSIGEGGEFVYGEGQTSAQLLGQAVTVAEESAANGGGNLAAMVKARALLAQGQFGAAATEVASVPTDYVYFAAHSAEAINNGIFGLQNARRYSLASDEGGAGIFFVDDGTEFEYQTGEFPYTSTVVDSGDPRIPFYQDPRGGFDENAGYDMFGTGRYPSRGSPTPVVTGVEARLIEAEAALEASQPGQMISILNALRADAPALLTGMFPDMIQAGTLAPLTDPGTAEARRDLLFEERAKWLFMTGRRLADLRRLVTQYGLTEDEAYPSGLYFKPGEGDYGDDGVFDVDVEEANNPLYSVGSCDPTNISLGG